MIKAIVGANWGDEGKGKITDLLAAKSDVVVRFQGGANAGHTIINDYGKFALHQLPSGIFQPRTANLIGNGMALNIPKLDEEMKQVFSGQVPTPKLMISDRVQMVMPYHVLFDQFEEERLGERAFGSTKSGIAPFYADKYAKIGFQVTELFDEATLYKKIERILEVKNVLVRHLYRKPLLNAQEIFDEVKNYKRVIEPYIGDTATLLNDALDNDQKILLEGQLGSMRDPDHGIYPMVTSSSTLAGFGAVGAGVPPYAIRDVIAVVKAYSSAVGAGPFISEIFGDSAQMLRQRGGDAGEYGATTGRPRRVGWFDAVASRYGCRIQGATEVALTAIDCLSYLDEIPVCVAYECEGKTIRDFPNPTKLSTTKPLWKRLKGWKTDIRGVTSYKDLPKEAKDYVDFVQESIGVNISMLSTGPKRDEIIFLR